MYPTNIKTFDELREYMWEEKQYHIELLLERLPELGEFERGSYYGMIRAYDEVLEALRSILKYGDAE